MAARLPARPHSPRIGGGDGLGGGGTLAAIEPYSLPSAFDGFLRTGYRRLKRCRRDLAPLVNQEALKAFATGRLPG